MKQYCIRILKAMNWKLEKQLASWDLEPIGLHAATRVTTLATSPNFVTFL